MRKFYGLLAILLLLGLTGYTAKAWADQPSDPKAVPQIEESLAASLGKDVVEAAHPSAKNISILEYKQSKSDGHLVASLKMRYYGKLSGAKYTANISITIDPAKSPQVLDLVYKDDNRIPANKKGLKGVRQNLETRLKNAWDAKQIAKAQQIKLARLSASSSRAANHPELVLQTGHTLPVSSVSFSPDGKRVATASFDHTAIVWDAASGEKLRTFQGHTHWVHSVSFSPDGKRLATASNDNTAIVWDAASGDKLRTLKGHTEGVFSVSFSPDGKRLATASYDEAVIVWDAATGDKLRTLKGQTSLVHSVSFSPDGKRLATATEDKTAVVWDVASGAKLRTLKGHTEGVFSVSFSPDGKRLATASGDKTAVVWDATSGAKLLTLTGHTEEVRSVSFSPDGKQLATASNDKTAVVWDATSGAKIRTLKGHTEGVNSVSFSPDGKRLATASYDKTAVVWDAASGEKIHTLKGHTERVTAVSFNPDGKRLATASDDKTAVVWDMVRGDKILTLAGHTSLVFSVSFSPDGKRLATASNDKTAMVWDAASGAKLRTLKGHTEGVFSVSFSPDGKRLATASGDKTAVVWDAASGAKLLTLTGHTEEVRSVSFSPDGKQLATASNDKTAVVWDAASGNKLHTLTGHTSLVLSVSFSPDGKRLATALYDNTAVVWDSASGDKLLTLKGHTSFVTSVSFSPDGKRLATASMDNTVVVWDSASGEKIRTLRGHTFYVRSVTFSPDGKWVCTGSEDGTATLWDAATGAELLRLISLDAGQDWLVVTPEGLFDGSAGGRNKVSYRVGKVLTVVPVDRFFKDFYRPGLLAATFRGERPKPEVDFGAQTPPKMRIVSPKASRDVEINPVTVLIEAEDQGGGIKTPWLRQNGVRVAAADPPVRDGKRVRQKYVISLIEGVNTLEAVSACADGSWESEPARIDLRYAHPVEKPRLFLISVGVNRYPDEALRLRFAAPDARAVHAVFTRRGRQLYREVVSILLADDKATRDGIRAAFRKVAKESKPQDTVLVYLAGHGTLVGQRYYYLPADFRTDKDKAREQSIRDGGLPDDELAELMVVPALKRVLILDTCNSGGAVALFSLRGRSPDALRGATERMNRAQGMYVLAAAPANAEAKEPAELGHGVLTYALLAGLRAASAGPLKGEGVASSGSEPVADVLGWLNFASGKVPQLMKKYYGREQDVQMSVSGLAGAPAKNFPILPLRD